MKLFVVSLFGSIFINFSYIALSSFPTGIIGGHSNSVWGAVAEGSLWTFGLTIIIPTVILFLFWRSYEKRHIESGKKSYIVHYTLIMSIIAIVLTVISTSLYQQLNEKKTKFMQSVLEQQQLKE